MRGKAVLWLGNLILIGFVTLNAHYALGLGPLAVGLAVLIAYSSYLAVRGTRRRSFIAPDEAQVGDLPPSFHPFVSLLVPAKNEARVIAATIESLSNLNYAGPNGRQFEIIAVDDGSTDDTFAVLKRLQQSMPELVVLRRVANAMPGKAAALNDALPLARGEVMGVFDADARVAPSFLRRALPRLVPREVGALQAQKRVSNAGRFSDVPLMRPAELLRRSFFLPLLQDIEMLIDTACQIARSQARGAVDLRGNGLLVKREALLAVGGWNNETLTDDLDLSTRLHAAGWLIAFCPEAVVWEEGVLTWRALFRQRRRWIEGHIRRYLDHADRLVRADIPATLKADALAFVAEFALPMWLFFGLTFWLLSAVAGIAYDPIVCCAIALGNVAMTLPFILTVTWCHVSRSPRVYPFVVLAVSVYLLHWLPVIIWTVLRLVLLRPQRAWAKTEHVGEPG